MLFSENRLKLIVVICLLPLILSGLVAGSVWGAAPTGREVKFSNIGSGYFDDLRLSPSQTNAFRAAKTMSLVVNQEYGYGADGKIDGYTLPFHQATAGLLQHYGMRIDEHSVNKLILDIKGAALSGTYTDYKSHYTGAKVSGTLTLKLGGAPTYVTRFEMVSPIAQKTGLSQQKSPSFAPFSDALDAHLYVICQLVGQVFGWDTLLSAAVASAAEIPNPVRPLGEGPGDGPVGNRPEMRGMNGTPLTVAGKVLAAVGDKGVAALTAALNHTSMEVREEALDGLANAKVPLAFNTLIPFLEDNRAAMNARYYLQEVRGKHFFDTAELIAALNHPKAEVRNAAISALRDARIPSAFKTMWPYLVDEATRNATEWYLSDVPDHDFSDTAAISAALKHESIDLQEDILRILWKNKVLLKFEILIPLLKDAKTKDMVGYYLKDITGQDFGTDIEKWAAWFANKKRK
jgi:hypothetical protein